MRPPSVHTLSVSRPDEPALSRAALRELDARATAEFGVPSALLMENAGRQAAERTLATLRAQALAWLAQHPAQV